MQEDIRKIADMAASLGLTIFDPKDFQANRSDLDELATFSIWLQTLLAREENPNSRSILKSQKEIAVSDAKIACFKLVLEHLQSRREMLLQIKTLLDTED